MNKFIKRFSTYIKFCVFLGVLTFGVISVTPREVNAKSVNIVVGESEKL